MKSRPGAGKGLCGGGWVEPWRSLKSGFLLLDGLLWPLEARLAHGPQLLEGWRVSLPIAYTAYSRSPGEVHDQHVSTGLPQMHDQAVSAAQGPCVSMPRRLVEHVEGLSLCRPFST